MTNYNTLLKSWGASGSEFPDGYSYIEGEQPVDDWDNFVTSNLINDTQHLISLTNTRLDSSSGSNLPDSGEDGEFFWHTTEKSLYRYQTDISQWKDFALSEDLVAHAGNTTNPHGVTLEQTRSENPAVSGDINLNSHDLDNVGQITPNTDGPSLQTSGTGTGSWFIQDAANSQSILEAQEGGGVLVPNGTISEQGDRVATRSWVDSNTENGVDVSEDGSLLVETTSDINFEGHLNVTDDGDGTVSIDPTHNHDGRYLNDGPGTVTASNLNFDPATQGDLHSKYTDGEAVSAVNTESSLTVDISGDADTLDGNHASAFANSGHNHDGRYPRLLDGIQFPSYTTTGEVPSAITEGEVVYISGEGALYVEDGT